MREWGISGRKRDLRMEKEFEEGSTDSRQGDLREGAGIQEREMGFEEGNRIRGGEKGFEKGGEVRGREQGFAETRRSRRHELGQGESTDSSQHIVTKKPPALPSPGSSGAAAGPHCAAEPRGGKGRQGNSWKQLETAGAVRGVRAAAALLRPGSSQRLGGTRGHGQDGGGHRRWEPVRGMFRDFMESWTANLLCPAAREGLDPAVWRGGSVWGSQAGWTGSDSGDARRPSQPDGRETQVCHSRCSGGLCQGKNPVPCHSRCSGGLCQGENPVPCRLGSGLAPRVTVPGRATARSGAG